MAGSSIRELAEAAGVSVATVSRVFNRHRCVRPAVRDRVLAIARDLHYAPSITTSRNLFGVIIGKSTGLRFGSYGDQVIEGITRFLAEAGLQTNILFGNQMDYLHENSYQALIVVCSDFNAAIAASGIKAVTVNQAIPGLPMVATDHAGGILQALDYLIGRGHTRIAYLCSTQADWGNEQRRIGYQVGLGRHAIPCDPALLAQFSTKADLIPAVGRLLAANPTALIVEGEDYGPAAYHAVRHFGRRIPEDLSLITFEDPGMSPYLYPEATTISQELCRLGELAAATAVKLADLKSDDDTSPCRLLPNCLIERHSVCTI